MLKATPNIGHVPSWDEEISDSYVRDCYNLYQGKWKSRYTIGDSYYGPHEIRYNRYDKRYHYTGEKADWVYIEDLYLEGRGRKVLNMDFSQFAEKLIKGYPRRYSRYWRRFEFPFRHKHEDVNWKEKGKKTVSEKEQIRRDWREKKGINRDNKKPNYRMGAGKWYKNHSNRLHRSWERQNLSDGNWDDLVNDSKIKFFQDSWMWL